VKGCGKGSHASMEGGGGVSSEVGRCLRPSRWSCLFGLSKRLSSSPCSACFKCPAAPHRGLVGGVLNAEIASNMRHLIVSLQLSHGAHSVGKPNLVLTVLFSRLCIRKCRASFHVTSLNLLCLRCLSSQAPRCGCVGGLYAHQK